MQGSFVPLSKMTTWSAALVGRMRRSALGLLAIGLLCGLGLTAAGVTLVRAADDAGVFEVLRFDSLQRMARAVRLRREVEPAPVRRVARSRSARRHLAEASRRARGTRREARIALASGMSTENVWSSRTVCVRTCDGYTFPLASLRASREVPAHEQACAAACPGAETALYTLAPGQSFTDLAGARSVRDGSVYGRLKTAFLFRKGLAASCSCQGPNNIATRLPILMDPTLRSGDLFVDTRGDARVFDGPAQVPHPPRAFADYRGSRAIGRTGRAEVDRLMGTSIREAAARAFERRVKTAQASLREVAPPAGSARGVRVFQASAGADMQAPGARIILIR